MSRRIHGCTLLLMGVLVLLHGPAIVQHVRNGANPRMFNDDVRQQISPFFQYARNGPVGRDVPAEYQSAMMPVGFRALYRTLAPVVDPESLSKVLPYLIYAVMLLGIWGVARTIGGAVAGVLAVALVLQAPVFLSRIVGGMPKAFAFAFVPLGWWALTSGRVRWLAGLAILSQAFYAVSAAILGLMLAVLLLAVPRRDRGEAATWGWRRRIGLLAIVLAVMGILAVPVFLEMQPWGRLLGPGDVVNYPEIGPGGRHAAADMLPPSRMPFPDVFVDAWQHLADPLAGHSPGSRIAMLLAGNGALVTNIILVLLVASGAALASQGSASRRALILPAASALGYVIARVLAPYLYVPQRYLDHTVALSVVVLLPAGMAALGRLFDRGNHATHTGRTAVTFAAALCLILLGGRMDARTGYWVVIAPGTKIYDFIGELPADALVAGWPSGPVNNVPYASRRRAFMTEENHLAFHEGYTLEMRLRMRVLVEALLGTDPQSVMRLRDRFGVTHLIVDTEHFRAPPAYFVPFTAETQDVWREGKRAGFALESLPPSATVFREGSVLVLDLSRL